MSKKLSELIQSIKPLAIEGNDQVDITSIAADSRKVTAGTLFVAVHGVNVDSHKFIDDCIASGAAAIVCQEMPATLVPTVTYVKVADSTTALALIAHEWYGRPSEHLKLVGVTGTNGKTTTATLLYELVTMMGHKAGLLSTVQNIIAGERHPALQTTPDHLSLNQMLAQMVNAGCEYAFMEVSSHACVQQRIVGLHFAGGVFTNLTRDHLDYHKTFENYLHAKQIFFDSLDSDAFALTNADDRNGEVMIQNTRARRRTYAMRTAADYTARILEERLDATSLLIGGKHVEVMFVGRYNAYNLLAVYGTALELGLDKNDTLLKLSMLVPVAGRFETFSSTMGYTAVVDYAHTPDALVNVLQAIREVMRGRGNIITVVGCGGNRDAGKRPIMAREAAAASDRLILTSDNPRDEDPDEILRQMEAGLDDEQHSRTLTITDRRQAIRTACQFAHPGDVVLIAGKGHEDYQEIKGVKHHFDDREEVRNIFTAEDASIH